MCYIYFQFDIVIYSNKINSTTCFITLPPMEFSHMELPPSIDCDTVEMLSYQLKLKEIIIIIINRFIKITQTCTILFPRITCTTSNK